MSKSTPENIESRFQRAQTLAQQSRNRVTLYMGLTIVGMTAFVADIAYLDQKYFPLTNTMEEIQRGQINPDTAAALYASTSAVVLLTFCAATILAAGYNVYRHRRYSREEDRLLKEMVNRSKRPPTLGS